MRVDASAPEENRNDASKDLSGGSQSSGVDNEHREVT